MTHMHSGMALLVAATALAACSPNWNEAATQDVEAMHTALLENHPGSVDGDNPEFASTLETAYRQAQARAAEVETGAGYIYALRSFTVPFQDQHLSVGFYRNVDRVQRYPGFLVSWSEGDMVVIRRDRETVPPLGAILQSCDGMSAAQLVAERVEAFIGTWAVASKRQADAPYILLDTANPFVPALSTCRFSVDGEDLDVTLDWQIITSEALNAMTGALEPRLETPIEIHQTAGGTTWISIGSFDQTSPDSAAALEGLLADIAARHSDLMASRRIVVDIRGNLGGSSEPGVDIASALFGEAYIDSVRPRFDAVDWRASAGNVAALDMYLPRMRDALGAENPTVARMSQVRDGMAQAMDVAEPYFREPMPGYVAPDEAPAMTPHPPVYLLTDSWCVSACLDFVDVMLSVEGVTQIGRPTSGDTRYLEVRTEDMPSGIAQLAFPAAIHRGRQRGDNEIYTPELAWPGDIADTAALEAWVAELP